MLLKIGSIGEDVKKLQGKFEVIQSGIFDNVLEAQIKSFQSKNGLKDDGIVGNLTWGKIFIPKSQFKLDALINHIPMDVIIQIPQIADKFGITNVLRLCHFLSQCSHESGNFTVTRENLNYSSKRLKEVFPSYFPSNLADSYGGKPEAIGSRVYANRMGNGNETTKEGYIFRGAGYIQLTGKSNFKAFSDFIGEDCVSHPELVVTKYPLASAVFFFSRNNLWALCDKGSEDSDVKAITKRVNGGYNGLEDRITKFKEFYNLLK